MSGSTVSLIAANRIEYFKQVVDSIVPALQGRELWVFIDYCGSRSVQEDHESYVKEKIPNALIVKRYKHYGCGRNIIQARRFLFDDHGVSRAFILEDDLVISPDYFTLCENLMRWAERRYSNIGAVQAWNFCKLSKEEKDKKYDVVDSTYNNWWAYLLNRSAWTKIRGYLLEFERKFLRIPIYGRRNHQAIYNWMRKNQTHYSSIIGGFDITDAVAEKRDHHLYKAFVTGQDAATMRSFENEGLVRLTTLANRSVYIGRSGVHFRPDLYKRMGFEEIEPYSHPNDGLLKDFRALGDMPDEKMVSYL